MDPSTDKKSPTWAVCGVSVSSFICPADVVIVLSNSAAALRTNLHDDPSTIATSPLSHGIRQHTIRLVCEPAGRRRAAHTVFEQGFHFVEPSPRLQKQCDAFDVMTALTCTSKRSDSDATSSADYAGLGCAAGSLSLSSSARPHPAQLSSLLGDDKEEKEESSHLSKD